MLSEPPLQRLRVRVIIEGAGGSDHEILVPVKAVATVAIAYPLDSVRVSTYTAYDLVIQSLVLILLAARTSRLPPSA
jgi:hypothetical protein